MPNKHIKTWIKHISEPRKEMNDFSVCPFAKKSKWQCYPIIDSKIDITLCKKEVTIFVLLDDMSKFQLEKFARQLNKQYPKFIFLPDHKTANTKIKGIATGNGKLNLILAQKRRKLDSARKVLDKKGYYKNLSDNYKKKLFSY